MSEPMRNIRRRAGRLLLVGALAATLAGCKTELYSKLSERDANEMAALLLTNGIEADRVPAKDGSSSIEVDRSRFAQAVEILKAAGYPRHTFANIGEVFKGGGLISSPTEERARYVYALSEELSKTISSIDGVLSARVHVVLPKNDLLKQDATPSSAAVFIRYEKDAQLKELLPQIKTLVANSIEGLTYEKVSVVFVPVDRSNMTAAIAKAAPSEEKGAIGGSFGLAAALAGLGGAAALGGGGYWFVRRRRLGQDRPDEIALGELEPIEPQPPHPVGDQPPVQQRVA